MELVEMKPENVGICWERRRDDVIVGVKTSGRNLQSWKSSFKTSPFSIILPPLML